MGVVTMGANMSKKPNKSVKSAPQLDPATVELNRKLCAISVALIICAVAKAVFCILFDLSAITNITGVMNADRAVESGMGRVCLATALVLFMAGVLGLGSRTQEGNALRNARLVAVVALLCGAATVVIGIFDGHNPADIACSLAGAVLSGALWYFVRR